MAGSPLGVGKREDAEHGRADRPGRAADGLLKALFESKKLGHPGQSLVAPIVPEPHLWASQGLDGREPLWTGPSAPRPRGSETYLPRFGARWLKAPPGGGLGCLAGSAVAQDLRGRPRRLGAGIPRTWHVTSFHWLLGMLGPTTDTQAARGPLVPVLTTCLTKLRVRGDTGGTQRPCRQWAPVPREHSATGGSPPARGSRRIQDPIRATGWGFNSPFARQPANTRPTCDRLSWEPQ